MNVDSCQPTEKRPKCLVSAGDDVEYENTNEIETTENDGEGLVNNDGEDNCGNIDNDSDSLQFPPDEDVSDMLEEVEYSGIFPTITERYFTPYYKLDVRESFDDVRVLVHSNRICMLTLAPSHAVFQNDRKITKIDFKVSEKLDRSRNKVSGKSKHGAQPLQANSNICTVSMSDGKTYTIKCCMIGKLVEVNEALLEDPQLLLQPPHKGGYLAVILPNIKLLEKMKETLLTQKQYEEAVWQRQNTKKDNGNCDQEVKKESSELVSNNKGQCIFSETS